MKDFFPSTRTPEGEPNRCPVCGHLICIEPSTPPGDAPCPDCGTLLWFPALGLKDSVTPALSEDIPRNAKKPRRRKQRKPKPVS